MATADRGGGSGVGGSSSFNDSPLASPAAVVGREDHDGHPYSSPGDRRGRSRSSSSSGSYASSSDDDDDDDDRPHADGSSICPWRTPDFHDQECARFFDCPSHVLARSSEAEGQDEHAGDPGQSSSAAAVVKSNVAVEEGSGQVASGGSSSGSGPSGGGAAADDNAVAAVGGDDPWAAARLPHPRVESPPVPAPAPAPPPVTADAFGPVRPPQQRSRSDPREDQPMSLREALAMGAGGAATAAAAGGILQPPEASSSGGGGSRAGQDQRPVTSSRTNASGNLPLPPAEVRTGAQQPRQRAETTVPVAAAQGGEASGAVAGHPALRVPSTPNLAPPAQRPGFFARQAAPREAGPAVDDRRGPPPIVLPRWQPDAEVTYCPICHSQFSIFLRKHHCRKCGRVVCASCSPHRITIPYQYIVQPPGQPQRYSAVFLGAENSLVDFNSVGGGERVRLCNPCVPDPNTTPPHQATSPGVPGAFPQRTHYRSQSSMSGSHPGESLSNRVLVGSAVDYSRSRSVTVHNPTANTRNHPGQPTSSRILAGTPPPGYYFYGPNPAGAAGPSSSATVSFSSQMPSGATSAGGSSGAARLSPYHPPPQQQRQPRHAGGGSGASSSGAPLPPVPPPPPPPPHHHSQHRHQPQQQQYLIPEEDECPVCHRELPRRTLPGWEALREAHVAGCIVAHSTYGGTPRAGSGSGAGGSGGGVGTNAVSPLSGSGSSSLSSGASPPPIHGHARRSTGMFPYLATEKDCVDSAECTICLEEFEVGVPMARLECLCRFHRRCIQAWFVGHPGRCPVHQHDSFGF